MAVRIQLRRAYATEWALMNPVLNMGEPGYEIDTGRLKVGDGNATWNDLLYVGIGPEDGVAIFMQTDQPVTDLQKYVWFDTTGGNLQIKYEDGT